MRRRPDLNEKQIKYLLDNANLSNIDLSRELGITAQSVANYKTRARQNGIPIPITNRRNVIKKMKQIYENNKMLDN